MSEATTELKKDAVARSKRMREKLADAGSAALTALPWLRENDENADDGKDKPPLPPQEVILEQVTNRLRVLDLVDATLSAGHELRLQTLATNVEKFQSSRAEAAVQSRLKFHKFEQDVDDLFKRIQPLFQAL